MEGRGSAVLGLGQLLAPFGEHQLQEEAASRPFWQSGGPEEEEDEEEKEQGDASGAAEEQDEAALVGLRRRHGRSLSLPASPASAAAARLFPGRAGGGAAKKRVQFADSLGLRLASVKHFSAAEEPQVPPAVLSRLQSFPMRRRDLEEWGAALAGLGGGAAAPPAPAPLPLEPRFEAAWGGRRRRPGPGRARVCLEEASGTALAGAPADVRGVVRVRGCPGAKEVTVRYTFNEWLSFLDAPAVPLPADGDPPAPPPPPPLSSSPVERYQFSLCLPPGLQEGTAVHFAVCCRSQQGEDWDNNGGSNYTLGPPRDAAPALR
uniref:protein phosphatase 1 regulatory subunit 3G n=1 Tax=Euleptes europaea TaxID=460621 RepID=UPI0025421E0E|nr:protein phosphatase 1 regulatory subunit 3G [Euleptes europaea]